MAIYQFKPDPSRTPVHHSKKLLPMQGALLLGVDVTSVV